MIKNITNQSCRNKFTVHSFSMKRPVRISANGITYKGTEENGKIIELRVKPRPTLMRSTHVCASSCPSDVSAGFIFLISASLFIFPFVIFSTLRLHILLNLF